MNFKTMFAIAAAAFSSAALAQQTVGFATLQPGTLLNAQASVIAKAVLQHVSNDEAALDELQRVLRPWGRLLIQTSQKFNTETVSIADPTMHYGADALAEYNVGTFRIYGDRSLLRTLQRRFLVKTFYGRDPVTGRTDTIFCGIKEG